MSYQRFRPNHRVTIRRAATSFLLEDISDDVVSIHTNKTYSHAAGGFQILTTFKPALQGKRYDEILQPDDIVHIELDAGDGSGLQSVMIGLVDRAARLRQMTTDGRPINRCKITGLDFGKFLVKHQCAADIEPLIGAVGSEEMIRVAQGVQFSGTPAQTIRSVFEVLFIKQVPWARHFFVLDLSEEDDWWTSDFPVLESHGAVWSAMKSLANEPYNILSTETYAGKLRITLEPFPVDPVSGKLSRLSATVIPDSDISFEDLGIGDDERVNYLYYRCDAITLFGGDIGAPLQYPPGIRYDADSVRRHGFLAWYPKSNHTPNNYQPFTHASPDTLKAYGDRAEVLWNRMRRNHELESGTLVVRGRPQVKAGGVVVLSGREMEYLAETVSHAYEWGQTYTTSLQVTRGQKHGS